VTFGLELVPKTTKGTLCPEFYRVPKVILGMDWGSKVDIWSIGVMMSTNGGQITHELTSAAKALQNNFVST
jgi:hypothetical protein